MTTHLLLPPRCRATTGQQNAQRAGQARAASGAKAPREVCFRCGIRRAEQVVPLLDRIAAALTALGYGSRDVFGFRLALEEAVVNGVKHGNRNDPAKLVRVECHLAAHRALVRVVDEGDGFDPAQVADPVADENLQRPGGRGLLLMRHYLTWMRFNDKGNRVTLCLRRVSMSRS